MMRSLLRIYDYSGRLPMWANVVETNIMIGTHVDAVLANALSRNFTSFNTSKAWEAMRKNAFEPPINDTKLLYYDREPYTPDEARAGLTAYLELGYVPNDQWAESASRTLDYAFDDHAAAIVARHAGDDETAAHLLARSKNYANLFNNATTSMQARNANGSLADPSQGWTEGDADIYTFAVPHDPSGLASLFGGPVNLEEKLDAYFASGANDHSNEPSHHVPYLYSAIGYPASTAQLTRSIAAENYNATASGLSGNEDLGQMSAWYVFSALGFYPLDPAGEEYVVGAPFFEEVTLRLPAGVATGGVVGFDGEDGEHEVVISAPGAPTKPFVKGLWVDGRRIGRAVLRHGEIVGARRIEFDMSEVPTDWGTQGDSDV
jgi:predicted alpha-1,2-mannosidase